MAPASGVGPQRLRFQPDLIDNCHQNALPVPPSLPPRGSCPNGPGSWYRVIPRKYHNYEKLRIGGLHHQCVSYGCRCSWHHHMDTNPGNMNLGLVSRYDYWRQIIAMVIITFCRLCDREQRSSIDTPPEIIDGCTCYRQIHRRRWLSRLCNILNEHLGMGKVGNKMMHRGGLKRESNEIKAMPAAQVPQNNNSAGPLCPW